jgi:hypothetical protein
LAREGKESHISLSIELVYKTTCAEMSGLNVVRPNEVEPTADPRVRIHGYDRDPFLDGCIELSLQGGHVRNRD